MTSTPLGSGHPLGDNVVDRATVTPGIGNDPQPEQPARGGPVSRDWSGVNVGTPPSRGNVEQAWQPAQPLTVSPLGPSMRGGS